MKKLSFLLLIFIPFLSVVAQKISVTWGDEFKMKKGSSDLKVVYIDKQGIYLKESHDVVTNVFYYNARQSATFIKMSHSLEKQFDNDYNKELKGKEFDDFFIIKGRIFLLANDYNRKAKKLTLFCAEIDKETGNLINDWKELANWVLEKEEKRQSLGYRLAHNYDSSNMILTSVIEDNSKNIYSILQFDDKLNPVDSEIKIKNEFDKYTYVLEDVLYAKNGNIFMFGKEYTPNFDKKGKVKNLDFKNYNICIYNRKGEKIRDIDTKVDGKVIVSSKAKQLNSGEIIFGSFYSNTSKAEKINGIVIQKISPDNGNIISSNAKELNSTEDTLGTKNSNVDGLNRYLRIRNFIATEGGGLILLAEKHKQYMVQEVVYTNSNTGVSSSTRTNTVFEYSDIFVAKINQNSQVEWTNTIPKLQKEIFYSQGFSEDGVYNSFFKVDDKWPFYSGFNVMQSNNSVSIIMNDHTNNSNVIGMGQKISPVIYFGDSDCIAININTTNGKTTRKTLFNNEDQPKAMPRLGVSFGNDLYIVGKDDKVLKKSKIAVAKFTIK